MHPIYLLTKLCFMTTISLCIKGSWIKWKVSTFFLILLLSISTQVQGAEYQETYNCEGCFDSLIIGEMPYNKVAYDLQEPQKEANFLLTFGHENKGSFSITLFDFQDEQVQVKIHDAITGDELYAINLEPSKNIFKSALLANPLPAGTYYVVVKGESRIIPKEITIPQTR